MSYIQSFKFIQDLTEIDLKNISKNEIIKIEKLLKANQKLSDNFNVDSVTLFVQSLQNHNKGLSFLIDNPNFVSMISDSFFFKKLENIKFEKENESEIKTFFKTYLEQDLINSSNLIFSKNQYERLKELLRFKDFLPVTVLHLIENKIETKLDYYINIADKIISKPSILNPSFVAVAKTINSKSINQKLNRLNSLISSFSLKAISRPGIVHFFYVMFNGLSWIGREPNSIEEKIEKQEILKDFKFMTIILGVIFILFFSVIVYSLSKDEERKAKIETTKNQNFIKGIYGYLTLFDSTQTSDVEYIKNLPSGVLYPEYFRSNSKANSFQKSVWVVNKSSYDLIVLPDQEFSSQFGFSLESYYIKAEDSLKINILINRIYLGKDLAVFKTITQDEEVNKYYKNYDSRALRRFKTPIENANLIIKNRFEFREGFSIIEQDGALFLKSNFNFFVNGIRYKSYEFK